MATVIERLRTQGIKANRSARGQSVTLDRTGTAYTAIVNLLGNVDYYGDGNLQSRSELQILRADLGDTLPAGGDVFIDSVNDLKHIITDAPDWMNDNVAVMFRCRVEVSE